MATGYSAYVPDFPGCVAAGDTEEEVSKRAGQADAGTNLGDLWVRTRERGGNRRASVRPRPMSQRLLSYPPGHDRLSAAA